MTDVSDPEWEDEAKAVMKDIQRHVRTVALSNLTQSKKKIFLNLTTMEKKDFCVELSAGGFQIVGERYDSDEKRGKYRVFETPYSMLDNLSPAYRDSFSSELVHKLEILRNEQEKEERDEKEIKNVEMEKEEGNER